jgi:exopolyphosphatase/guanosine-5'-triphosphate,3'-diphosphate pyrophosphatase
VGLAACRLQRHGNTLVLRLGQTHADLAGGDAVQRRLRLLGGALNLTPRLEYA